MANVNGEGEAGFRLQLCRQSTLLRLEDNSQLGSSASGQRSLWEKIKHGPIAPIAPIIRIAQRLLSFASLFMNNFKRPLTLPLFWQSILTLIQNFLVFIILEHLASNKKTTIPLNASKDRERRTGEMDIWSKTPRAKRSNLHQLKSSAHTTICILQQKPMKQIFLR